MQILVHGEKTNMMRLKSKLLSLNVNRTTPVKVFSPANCEELRIPFRQDKIAKVVGRLANQIQISAAPPSPPSSEEEEAMREDKKIKTSIGDQVVSGVLVQNDFKLSLMAPEDLKEYAGLTTTTIVCRQRLTLAAASLELIKWALEGTFGAIKTISTPQSFKAEANGNGNKTEEADEEIERSQETVLEVMGAVKVKVATHGEIEVEWEGNIANDGIADAVLAVLFTVESSPAAVKRKCILFLRISLRDCLTQLQNHLASILTITAKANVIFTHISAHQSACHVYACSSKHNLAKMQSRLSRNPNSPSPRTISSLQTIPSQQRRPEHSRKWLSWNDCTRQGSPCRDWRSRWTRQ